MLPKIECTLDNIIELTTRTKVLINCIGPYTLTGEKIIQACIDTETHYVDIWRSTKGAGDRILKISGVDPGYRSTSIFLTQSAVTLIEEISYVSPGWIINDWCKKRRIQ
ncbi:saccharopine dehydrogenase-like oxidoreductase [Arctopsyche grandis]|uniref:saccharopine dehydrogenase-like oxidoreductase n=1 Tax=Arctopsyche grandis TaxID=121162 RepID=UPI00406D9BF2